MVIFVRIMGIFFIVAGMIFSLRQDFFDKYISFWKNSARLNTGGVLAIIFGILFLMAASACRITWFINLLGIWSIIKGVLLLTLKYETIVVYLNWWKSKPKALLRFMGVFALAMGVFLIYSA